MDKELGQFKITRTDTGFRIDVEGKGLGGICTCCCCNTEGSDKSTGSDCSSPKSEDK